jgi:predicted helicase
MHNVFGIQTGVAISFLIKRAKTTECQIRYFRRPRRETSDEKLSFLSNAKFAALKFDLVNPNVRHDWIDQADTDFETLVPFISKPTKYAKNRSYECAICKLYSLRISTNRDEWVVDFSEKDLARKISYFIKRYESFRPSEIPDEADIKLSRNLKWKGTAARTIQ